MSREEIERSRIEEEGLGLRRSQRNKSKEVDVENSKSGVDLESGDSWGLEGLTAKTGIEGESEESVEGESVHSFGEFSNTAYHNHNFEEEEKTRNPSFKGVLGNKEMSKGTKSNSVDSGVGGPHESGLIDLMREMMQNQTRRDQQREQERRDEMAIREQERREEKAMREEERREAREREDKLFSTINKAPEPPRPHVNLPKLVEGGEIESFLVAFETALTIGGVDEGEWKNKLISNIPMESLIRMSGMTDVEDMGYSELKEAIRGTNEISFCRAAEDWSTGERGEVFKKGVRSACTKLVQLHRAVTREAATAQEMAEATTVAKVRENLVPELKAYVDLGQRFAYKDFIVACEEWERSQPKGTACFKHHGMRQGFGKNQSYLPNMQSVNRQRPACFACGKMGHIAREWECRSRPPGVEAVTAPVTPTAPVANTRGNPKFEVTCFRCGKKGHKSPECPTKPKTNKNIRLPEREPLRLSEEELFGEVNGNEMCITIDTGAQISVVPKEFVLPEQWTGNKRKVRAFQGTIVEGDECRVEFTIGGRKFARDAVAVEGELIQWTPCFRVPLASKEEMMFVTELAEVETRRETAVKYQPPRMVDGVLQAGFMVSDGDEFVHTPTQRVVSSSEGIKGAKVVMDEQSEEEVVNGLMNIEAEEYGDHGPVDVGKVVHGKVLLTLRLKGSKGIEMN